MGIEQLFDGTMDAEPIAVTPETPAEPIAEVVAPEVAERAAETPTPEPVASPEPQEGKHVPLAVFLDARDEAKELKRWKVEREAQDAARVAPDEMPDPIDDPRGFADWQEARITQRIVAERFTWSDNLAKQQHGAEVVETAAKWAMERAKSDPSFHQAYMQQQHPLDWIVREHKRSDLISKIGDDEEAYIRRRYAELNPSAPIAAAAPAVAAQAQPASVAPSPPRSLASEPSKGGGVKEVATGPMSALESVFRG